MIKISNMKKAGYSYESTKLAALAQMISEGVRKRTNNRYIATSKIKGNVLFISIKALNKDMKYVNASNDEYTILSGRIANFLLQNGISADVEVV